ncbi:MAG: 2-amino-4-hydroxy-6-hydroxymethyldihydropteridine diphosphokinase [Bacteroidota bacterium]|jgi:2-amino-4-hydroxy-6-hydroxymethyldihydropteridine diphosphokinase
MSTQNTVVLSLGTNLGNRLQNVETAIALLHEKAGTVVKVSGLYETPSWGFESTPFYNCALLMHTQKEAKLLLEVCQAIEVEMGRAYTKPGYEARIIDIDVIAFNEEIISTTTLQVPHPLMQDRLFVLLPMRDLQLDWRHPILQKHLPDLLKASEDKSNCVFIQKLIAPIRSISLEQFNYIAIEGNIGAGKTTLALKIADDFNAKTVLERFADNPFLPKFYEDQNRFAFPLEMSFLADRYQQIADDLAQFDLFKDFIVADYHIFKSLIFAKVTLTDDEYRLYRKLFEIIYKEMPKPDLYIYLYQNTERLLANIKKRGREYEQDIAADYLEKINQGYLDYIKSQTDLNVLIIDVSDRDFVQNQEDYVYILSKIQEKLAPAN